MLSGLADSKRHSRDNNWGKRSGTVCRQELAGRLSQGGDDCRRRRHTSCRRSSAEQSHEQSKNAKSDHQCESHGGKYENDDPKSQLRSLRCRRRYPVSTRSHVILLASRPDRFVAARVRENARAIGVSYCGNTCGPRSRLPVSNTR